MPLSRFYKCRNLGGCFCVLGRRRQEGGEPGGRERSPSPGRDERSARVYGAGNGCARRAAFRPACPQARGGGRETRAPRVRPHSPPPPPEPRLDIRGAGAEEVVTENSPGLRSVWPEDRAPERRWGGVRSRRGENGGLASGARARRALRPRPRNFSPTPSFCAHGGCRTWNPPGATSPKRSVGRVATLVGSEEPGRVCGSARERGPHCPVRAPPVPCTEVGEGSVPSPRPCFAPDLQGQSGSDRTGAAHTWPRAVPILTPARPKQLSGTQLPS